MKEVMITVVGKQAQPDGSDEDTIELVTEGQYEKRPDGIAISYVESELTGFAGCTTTFLVKADCITMNRFGSECGDMVFEVGKRHQYCYATEVGNMLLGVNTLSVRKELDDEGGQLAISYLLDFDDRVFSRNSFLISIK